MNTVNIVVSGPNPVISTPSNHIINRVILARLRPRLDHCLYPIAVVASFLHPNRRDNVKLEQ